MKIELLGTGGYYANSRRQTACVLLPEWGIVFDAGSAIFRLPERCSKSNIHLFLTHPHLDHIVGLPFLLMPVLSGQFSKITVYAAAKTLQAVGTHLFAEEIFPVAMPFARTAISPPGTWELRPGVRVCWQELTSHPGGSMAYRVDIDESGGACSMAYVTDTCVDGTYADFISGVDLLIHECYFGDDRANLATRTGHSCASQVAELALAANVGELIVVHVDPTLDVDDPIGLSKMRSLFPRTRIGTDGLQVDIPATS